MRLLVNLLLASTVAEFVRRAQTPDTEYYGRPDGGGLGWCPLRQYAFAYMLGGSICAPKCSSVSECPPPSGGAKGPVECLQSCFLRCKEDSDCPELSGGESFCGKQAAPFAVCFWK
ncbi:hypothetical protein FOL47_009764 [Perkinsus chesapeaki]|uniref:Secreted protein n=1 Tax=Perkinsus chesapeaki TaxID=330153 RepID=A0A7J6L6L1_PERCH|nr:hypothetical protein FOL47_009764 [Perkinsus chesapeaki]